MGGPEKVKTGGFKVTVSRYFGDEPKTLGNNLTKEQADALAAERRGANEGAVFTVERDS